MNHIRGRLAAGLSAAATSVIYLPALRNGFVTWDDSEYIYENLYIMALDVKFLKWAFFSFHSSNWHPLTWLSHAIDYAIWGLDPLGHHLTSVVLHGLNTFIVVLLAIRLLEAAEIRSRLKIPFAAVITGLLFGLHPLNVESVAWGSERKNVLCGFFFLLSLLSYIRYVNWRVKGQENPGRWFFDGSYLSALGLFFLALLSKPMAVSLPVVLLIIDWYPFRRFEGIGKLRLLIIEKLPFFMLSLAAGLITLMAQKAAMKNLVLYPLSSRILVGFKSLIAYPVKALFPGKLIPFYPYPGNVSLLSYEYLIPLLLVVGIAAVCLIISKRQRMWAAVAGYYLVTILPVLGIIQVGDQAMADRYAYLPCLGPFLIIGLGVAHVPERLSLSGYKNPIWRASPFFVAGLLLIIMSLVTIRQIGIWKDGRALWTYELKSEPVNHGAYNGLGAYYLEARLYDKALKYFTEAVRLTPVPNAEYYYNRAHAYAGLERYEEAAEGYTEAIRLSHGANFSYYNDRAIACAKTGRYKDALRDYLTALSLNSGAAEVYYNLGNLYMKLGRHEEALKVYTQAINLIPRPNPDYYNNRGIANKELGYLKEAIRDLRQADNIRNAGS